MSLSTRVRDVIVVGGGPAGSATTLFLRQQGHDVLLIDAARFPRDKICGEAVSPEAWRLLASLDVASRVRALEPYPLRGMRLVSPDGTSFCGDYSPWCGFSLRREVLDTVLVQGARAAGAEVREATRATALLIEGGSVTGITCDGGESLRARLVIGADGRRSIVARQLGLLKAHRSLRKFAVRGYWSGVQGLEERGEMHVGGGGYCGLAPLSHSLANVAFVVDRSEMTAAAGNLESFYRTTLKRWPEVEERLSSARLLGAPRAIGPLALEARGVSAPGALLVGDSAGFYDPFTGEGVTLALRSAEIAASVASKALRGRADLSTYDRLRKASTQGKFRLNHLLQRVVAWPAASNALARRLSSRPELANLLVGIAGDFVPARALGLRFFWQLLS